MRSGKGNASCQTCRARHLDCDKTEPTCRRCEESGRNCVPGFNVRFRRRRNSTAADAGLHVKGRLAFEKQQRWVKTPKELSFVDETRSIGKEPPTPRSQLPGRNSMDRGHSRSRQTHGSEQHDKQDPLAGHSSDQERSLAAVAGAKGIVAVADLLTSPQGSLADRSSDPRGSLYVDPVRAKLIDSRVSELLHYFKIFIGRIWFDVTDPGFTREALSLAPYCPILLYSMLATACIHKGRFTQRTAAAAKLAEEADGYHEQCVSLLLPMLTEKDSITDGAFLASSTILRFYEEISAPVHGGDDARHLLGGYASVTGSQAQIVPRTGLGNGGFWIHQRQDVYNAILNQRLPKTDLGRADMDRSAGPADDYVWAKRCTCLLAEVVDFCLGPDAASAAKYEHVSGRLEEWYRHKPESFAPVFYRKEDVDHGRAFPEVCLLLDHCVFGMSYYYLCLILLAIFDPTVPRIGPASVEGHKTIRESVLQNLRLLSGLALSNPVPTARVMTCMALMQCGSWISGRIEQNATIELLQLIEEEDAWPTLHIQETLKAHWKENTPLDAAESGLT